MFNIGTFKPLNECPVSYITDESNTLVEQIDRSKFATETTGTSLYGENLSAWPPWAVETAICAQSETNKIENARHEAEEIHAANANRLVTEK